MSEVQENNGQTRPATATATATGAGKGNWNFFGTGQKTETQQDKPKEPEKDYIKKFEDQTTFIFGGEEDIKEKSSMFGTKEKKPLKVILKGLYDEYYKKMMDGVLEFTNTEENLNDNVINMFKRALQALAEKKRIDEAAPPYEFKESKEDSKSVISQMVVYEKIDGVETKKRLPILIYDPCIFELENGVKPSIEGFHTTIQQKFNDFELVGMLDTRFITKVSFFNELNIKGGGKYVGGGISNVKKVLEELNGGLLESRQYLVGDGYSNYNDQTYNARKESMIERKKIRGHLRKDPEDDGKVPRGVRDAVALNEYLTQLMNDFGKEEKYKNMLKDILKIIILHFVDPNIENNVADAENTALEGSDNLTNKDQQNNAATNMRKAIEKAKLISHKINTSGHEGTEEKFTDFLDKNFFNIENVQLKKLGENIKNLLQIVGVDYQGVMTSGNYLYSFTKGVGKRIDKAISFGKKEATAETAGAEKEKEAEEAVPEDILLKHILNFGVWKLKSDNSTPEKFFMIEPKMMRYLLRGTPTDGSLSKDVFLPINYTQSKVADYWNSAEGEKPIPMEEDRKEEGKFYEKNFSFDVYKYKVENGFEQSEWYSEYEKTQQTQTKGGQSKNTTAKRNKSKKNKSKKNK